MAAPYLEGVLPFQVDGPGQELLLGLLHPPKEGPV